MERYAYCNLLIIALTCWVSYVGFRRQDFEDKYIFWPQAILAWRQYYRLVTPAFLHLDWRHLLMNMLSLYFFGPMIEALFGPTQFLGIYLAAVVGGNLLALYIHRRDDYRALGASGGVAGIIFAHILFFPGGGIGLSLFLPVYVPAWLYAIGYLLYSFSGMQRGATNVGHDAHLGGALVGFFTAAAIHPFAVRASPILFGAITTGAILLYIYLLKNPLLLPWQTIDFTRRSPQPAPSGNPSGILTFWKRKRSAPAGNFSRPDRRVDALLQKISKHGIESLTEEEKKSLSEVSDKYRRRAIRANTKWQFPI